MRRCLEGRVLGGRYRVGELLGSGAMGRVYTARHVELGRACAVKVIRPPGDELDIHEVTAAEEDVEDAIARFRVEALAASRLDHLNVLRVLDFGREPDDGLWYLVTEQLDGRDLIDVMVEAPLPTERIVAIMRQVCAALQHAHERGVVHRDVKPENVRLVPRVEDDGALVEHVKLMDFGTALVAPGEPLTNPPARERLVVGTPAYMSPEQALGQSVDARSDIYACGVVLFEMTTGRLPFERPSPFALAAAHIECRPPAPSSIRDAVDPELEAVILWCLRKKPTERPQSARVLREALDRISARIARASDHALAAPPAMIAATAVMRSDTTRMPRSDAPALVVDVPPAPPPLAAPRPRPRRKRAAIIIGLSAALATVGAAVALERTFAPRAFDSIASTAIGGSERATAPIRLDPPPAAAIAAPSPPSPLDTRAPAPAKAEPDVPAETARVPSPLEGLVPSAPTPPSRVGRSPHPAAIRTASPASSSAPAGGATSTAPGSAGPRERAPARTSPRDLADPYEPPTTPAAESHGPGATNGSSSPSGDPAAPTAGAISSSHERRRS